jgi:hypothetical protein
MLKGNVHRALHSLLHHRWTNWKGSHEPVTGHDVKCAGLGLSVSIPHTCENLKKNLVKFNRYVSKIRKVKLPYTSDDLNLYCAETGRSGALWFCSRSPSKGRQQTHMTTADIVNLRAHINAWHTSRTVVTIFQAKGKVERLTNFHKVFQRQIS